MATPQQKAFCVLEFSKTNAIVMCNVFSEENLALIRPIATTFHGSLDSLKRVGACAKEKVLEDQVLQKNGWRGFKMHLRVAHVSPYGEQVFSLLSHIPLSGMY